MSVDLNLKQIVGENLTDSLSFEERKRGDIFASNFYFGKNEPLRKGVITVSEKYLSKYLAKIKYNL